MNFEFKILNLIDSAPSLRDCCSGRSETEKFISAVGRIFLNKIVILFS